MCAHGDRLRGLLRAIAQRARGEAGRRRRGVPGLERPFIAAGSRSGALVLARHGVLGEPPALVRRLRSRMDASSGPSTSSAGRSWSTSPMAAAACAYFHFSPTNRILTAVIVDIVRPGSTVIDIGANIGFFTVLAANDVSPRVGGCSRSSRTQPRGRGWKSCWRSMASAMS